MERERNPGGRASAACRVASAAGHRTGGAARSPPRQSARCGPRAPRGCRHRQSQSCRSTPRCGSSCTCQAAGAAGEHSTVDRGGLALRAATKITASFLALNSASPDKVDAQRDGLVAGNVQRLDLVEEVGKKLMSSLGQPQRREVRRGARRKGGRPWDRASSAAHLQDAEARQGARLRVGDNVARHLLHAGGRGTGSSGGGGGGGGVRGGKWKRRQSRALRHAGAVGVG